MSTETATRAEISEAISKAINLPKQRSSEILDVVFEEMGNSLAKDGELKLSSFGTFFVRKKKERVGRNPKTGKEVMIQPRRTVSFRPSHILRTRIEKGNK